MSMRLNNYIKKSNQRRLIISQLQTLRKYRGNDWAAGKYLAFELEFIESALGVKLDFSNCEYEPKGELGATFSYFLSSPKVYLDEFKKLDDRVEDPYGSGDMIIEYYSRKDKGMYKEVKKGELIVSIPKDIRVALTEL